MCGSQTGATDICYAPPRYSQARVWGMLAYHEADQSQVAERAGRSLAAGGARRGTSIAAVTREALEAHLGLTGRRRFWPPRPAGVAGRTCRSRSRRSYERNSPCRGDLCNHLVKSLRERRAHLRDGRSRAGVAIGSYPRLPAWQRGEERVHLGCSARPVAVASRQSNTHRLRAVRRV